MFALLATHYVFDLGYHPKAKHFYMFLEQLVDISDIRGRKKSANFLSIMTGIESFRATYINSGALCVVNICLTERNCILICYVEHTAC